MVDFRVILDFNNCVFEDGKGVKRGTLGPGMVGLEVLLGARQKRGKPEGKSTLIAL